MKRASLIEWLWWATVAAVWGALAWPASGQHLTRDVLYPTDPDRSTTILWSRGDPADPGALGLIRHGDTGDLANVFLRAADGRIYSTTKPHMRETSEVESWHWKAFRVEPNTQPGVYVIVIAGRDRGSITVGGKRQSNVLRFPAGEVQTNYTVPPNTVLRGHGCTLSGNLTVSAGCTVIGLTIDGNVTGTFNDVVFDSCTFRRGVIGPMLESDRQALFKDCRFENATVNTCSSGLFLRCTFTGRAANHGHNFVNERATRLALINCTFDGTDRGIIARPRWGDNSDNLYAGIWFRNIAMTNNGGELLCVEANSPFRFDRNLCFCWRQTACTGGVMLFDAQANDNLFHDVRVPVDITGMAKQTGNHVQESECEYVRINWPVKNPITQEIEWMTGAKQTRLRNVYSVGFTPRARGTFSGDKAHWADTKFQAVFQDGSPNPSTLGYNLSIRGQSDGFIATKGIQQ